MKTTYLMILCMIALVLGAGAVHASEDNVMLPSVSRGGDYYDSADGAPMNALIRDSLSFWDKLRVGSDTGAGLTMIDGALCSTHADREMIYTPSASSIQRVCYTNIAYAGTAFQAFRRDEFTGGWHYLGERQLSNGEKGCFDVTYGQEYMLSYYYCAATGKVCEDFQSTASCNIDSQGGPYTVRERSCTENGRTFTERVTVNWYDSSAPSACTAPETDDGPDTTIPGGSTGDTGSSTGGSSGTAASCSGVWNTVDFPSNVLPGTKYSGLATFTPSVSGACILSASMAPTPTQALSIVSAEGSACGQPDPYVAEAAVSVTAGVPVEVHFNNLQARDASGVYNVHVQAWTGCAKDGGSMAATSAQPVNVLTVKQQLDSGLAAAGGLGGLFLFFGIVLLIAGLVYWAVKR